MFCLDTDLVAGLTVCMSCKQKTCMLHLELIHQDVHQDSLIPGPHMGKLLQNVDWYAQQVVKVDSPAAVGASPDVSTSH